MDEQTTLRRRAYADWLEENGQEGESSGWRDEQEWTARGRPQPPDNYDQAANQWSW